MSTPEPVPAPSSRPNAITALAVITLVLGLGQAGGAGLLPEFHLVGILLGVVLLAGGAALLLIRRLWQTNAFPAYLDLLAGTMFLVVAINGALGLGLAEQKVPALFVAAFVVIGLVFYILGWLLLRKLARE